jgi:esterase/lipase superfamily enzyme
MMTRTHHRWHSPHLDREMDLLVFGHAGAKVLVFPTRRARFHEYEDLRIVESLRPRIEAGEMQLWCVDSVDTESFYNTASHPTDRVRRHEAYERYVVDEVVPLMQATNDDPRTVSHGCSMGAYHAANTAFRHPHLFNKLAAFSGRYDPTIAVERFRDLLDGHVDEKVVSHAPVRYLPELDGPRLDDLRRMDIVLVVGREDPFVASNRELSDILRSKGIAHTLHEWEERAHKGHYWRRMAPQYL